MIRFFYGAYICVCVFISHYIGWILVGVSLEEKIRVNRLPTVACFADFPALVGGFFVLLVYTCAFSSVPVMFFKLDNKL
jgi:hypothetical protein